MAKHHPEVPFERFADDAVCHCSSEYQARRLQVELERRFAECGLALHSDKTQIVYCKDHARRGPYPHQKFDFLVDRSTEIGDEPWGKDFRYLQSRHKRSSRESHPSDGARLEV